MNKEKLTIIGIVVAVIAAGVLILVSMLAAVHNTAITYEQSAQNQKSVIGVQLQRRHDLILSLVNTVTAAGNFEKSTLTDVIAMRQAASTGNVEQAQLSLKAVVEAYPDIKSVAAYMQLQTELATTENLISEQRKTYNSTVQTYQSFVQGFPSNVLLALTGYQKKDYQYLDLATPDYSTNLFNNQSVPTSHP